MQLKFKVLKTDFGYNEWRTIFTDDILEKLQKEIKDPEQQKEIFYNEILTNLKNGFNVQDQEEYQNDFYQHQDKQVENNHFQNLATNTLDYLVKYFKGEI